MKSGSGHSGIRLRGCGFGHCNAEDSETQRPGNGCTACRAGGFLPCAGITHGPTSASTPEPKVRTGCSSAARPDLCGGRPDPIGAKGRLYRDHIACSRQLVPTPKGRDLPSLALSTSADAGRVRRRADRRGGYPYLDETPYSCQTSVSAIGVAEARLSVHE